MKLTLQTATGGYKCRYDGCEQKPEYFTPAGRIKTGTTCVCLKIKLGAYYSYGYFCYDCINKIYVDMKCVLDPNLWLFK